MEVLFLKDLLILLRNKIILFVSLYDFVPHFHELNSGHINGDNTAHTEYVLGIPGNSLVLTQ